MKEQDKNRSFSFLPDPVAITDQRWPEGTVPLVQVRVMAYMHEAFIEECLRGIVKQKTTFPVQVLVHDDASTDKTADIIRSYEKKYPNLIKIYCQKINSHSRKDKFELRATFHSWRISRYEALCEGDDYWIDPLKLQKQVVAMDAHPEVNLCFHPAIQKFADGSAVDEVVSQHSIQRKIFDLYDVVLGGGYFMPTASLMIRREGFVDLSWRHLMPVGDTFLQIYASRSGGALFLSDVMCVYRKFAPGSWSENAIKQNNIKSLYDGYARCFELMRKDFPKHQELLNFCIAYYRKSSDLEPIKRPSPITDQISVHVEAPAYVGDISGELLTHAQKYFNTQKKHDIAHGFFNWDDEVSSSTTWQYSLALAYSEFGEMNRAGELIEKIYGRDCKRKDLYSRCAWMCFWKRRLFRELIYWIEKEATMEKISSTWMLNLAKAYMMERQHEKAMRTVDSILV